LGVGSRKGCEEGGHCVLLRVIGGIYVLISWFCKDLRGCWPCVRGNSFWPAAHGT
jgi:hypothetical protein